MGLAINHLGVGGEPPFLHKILPNRDIGQNPLYRTPTLKKSEECAPAPLLGPHLPPAPR